MGNDSLSALCYLRTRCLKVTREDPEGTTSGHHGSLRLQEASLSNQGGYWGRTRLFGVGRCWVSVVVWVRCMLADVAGKEMPHKLISVIVIIEDEGMRQHPRPCVTIADSPVAYLKAR